MDPEALSAALLAVVAPLAEARRPGASEGLTSADLPLERPKNRDHGDWASNAALKLAKRSARTRASSPPRSPRASAPSTGVAASRSPVPASSTSAWMPPPPVRSRKTIVEAGDAYGTTTRAPA